MAPLPTTGTVAAIYAAYEARADRTERKYLGMSTMGQDCDRALWYAVRWAHRPEQFDGRKLRLFETGHREEARLIADLKAAGLQLVNTGGDNQVEVTAIGGHFRGHLDGLALAVPEAPKTMHVVECKTHNQKSFGHLCSNGVAKSKPGHWRQMQLYMHHFGATRALYVAQNKNDEGIYVERVEYDAASALQLVARAERIIGAHRPPTKLHDNPDAKMAFACGWCPAKSICHEGDFARRNCRTCLHATPVVYDGDDAIWRCERFDRDLTIEEQQRGCPAHRYIPNLVPGEQIDAAEDGSWVSYRLTNGATYVDNDATVLAEASL